jgi:flagellum-specific peptidoglycan hydrolase FlgJ/murein DD-endopeptidase MepM/ murein hydrolase activator NlpD
MRRYFPHLLILLLFVFSTACGSKKKVRQKNKNLSNTTQTKKSEVTPKKEVKPDQKEQVILKVDYVKTTQEYIDKYAEIAKNKMRKHGIPASITMAQGILESSSGRSSLTRSSNNHFGIKCHKGWMGEKTYYDDDEKGECFRVYNNPEGSFEDHSTFLTTRSRYASLFTLEKDDYYSWAYGLSKAGYATDKKYPQKLISIIERYKLHELDEEVLGTKSITKNINASQPQSYIVNKGETLYAIGKKYGINPGDIIRFNNLKSADIFPGQELKLSNPKTVKQIISKETVNNVAKDSTVHITEKYHRVQTGETLHSISQEYNITVEALITFNKLQNNDLETGQLLVLHPQKVKIPDYLKVNNTQQKKYNESNLPEFHIVELGENVNSIAYKYGVEVSTLKKLNRLSKENLNVGQKIYLPKPVKATEKKSTIENDKHIVAKGETLFSISRLYNISVNQLKAKNNLKGNTISIGQELIIK